MHTKTRLSRSLSLIAISTLCTLITGCSLGPGVLKSSRLSYNKAVHTSANEELLLNMVRLRYREPMQFLQIGNITSQYSYSTDLSLKGSIPLLGSAIDVLTANGSVARSEKPTISYKPLEGKQFVNRVLEETNLNTFLLLIRGGWNIERVSRILVDSVGELTNYPKYSSYGDFVKLMQLWDKLQDRGDLVFTYLPGKNRIIADSIPKSQVVLENLVTASQQGYSIKPSGNGQYQLTKTGPAKLVMKVIYRSQTEADQADTLLGVKPQHTITSDGGLLEHIEFTDTLLSAESQVTHKGSLVKLPLVLRSFSKQLFALSRSIKMPEKDQAMVKTHLNSKGESIDVRKALSSLINIKTSSSILKPDNALVAVDYRGAWFYIDKNDGKSLSTFAMLTLLYSLQAGEEESGPVLTIPIGG